MSSCGDPASADNPFSARRVRPGSIPYCLPQGRTVDDLVRRLEANNWRSQIVGPHGSGKSALLATLIQAIEAGGRPTLLVDLHDGCRRLPVDLRRAIDPDRSTLVIVDGYEQLSRLSRWRLKRFCRKHGLGLLVTAHGSVGLPDLCRTAPSLDLARWIIEQLAGPGTGLIGETELEESFHRHEGNLREVIFELYDLYEERGPGRRE